MEKKVFLNIILISYAWKIFSYMPYAEFKQKFQLGSSSTEKLHPTTMKLSQSMHKDILNGLELLLSVDEEVIKSFEKKSDDIYHLLIPQLHKSLQLKGRIFLVGAGSSGRIAIDLAAKSKKHTFYADHIEAIIAGGDSAVVRAREGFEDSENAGALALAQHTVNQHDTVILISGSGSANFNVGCGNLAADRGAHVFYFYNSTEIPERTSHLFCRKYNPVIPLLVDSGAQAIAGSTRLQAASLALIFLGSALEMALSDTLTLEAQTEYKNILLYGMRDVLSKIRLQRTQLQNIIKEEVAVFSNPLANFRRLMDYSQQGYVTMLAPLHAIREVFIDTTEIPPTFSTNGMRSESEIKKKRPEFQAYLLDEEDNKAAWQKLLGREIRAEDELGTLPFLLSIKSKGVNSYANRPTSKGNIVCGVSTLLNNSLSKDMVSALQEAKLGGATTITVLVSPQRLSDEQQKIIKENSHFSFVLEEVQNDPFGIIHSFALKIILNLLSNSSMILMNKVFGNRMIDLNPSNYKLIDRSIRIINDIWDKKIDHETLYNYIQQLYVKKKARQENGYYVPSIVTIILTMLYKNKTPDDFEEVLSIIDKNHESLNFLDTNGS